MKQVEERYIKAEIARKMLAKGMDEASIMDMTGLTAEEIKLLKAEM